MKLSERLTDGQKHEITQDDYWYYLEVMPPAVDKFTWGGEQWNFGFAEGLELVVGFKKEGDRYYAQRTDILNPAECGVSVEDQALGKADKMKKALADAHERLRKKLGNGR